MVAFRAGGTGFEPRSGKELEGVFLKYIDGKNHCKSFMTSDQKTDWIPTGCLHFNGSDLQELNNYGLRGGFSG